jgi:hypothetical protein
MAPSQNFEETLLPSKTSTNLEGFKIRLDLGAWEPLVSTGRDGHSDLPQVPRFSITVPRGITTILALAVRAGPVDLARR